MINGISHYNYNHQGSQIYQRSSDMRYSETSDITSQSPPAIQEGIQISTVSPMWENQYNTPDTPNYMPATSIWNLNRFLRKCGLPIPAKYCSKMWCVRDIAGYVAAGFTWSFIGIGELLIILNCLATNNVTAVTCINILVTMLLSLLAFISHCKCMFSDPGTVPRGTATTENISKINLSEGEVILKCVKCDSIKPDRAHHCSVCRRCVRKMDHHCPWINNCVGECNQKFFVLFTGYVCLMSCYGFAIAFSTLLTCLVNIHEDTKFMSGAGCYYSLTTTLLISVGLLMESLLFGLFTAIMCSTQMCSICHDKTGIESLKKDKRQRMTWRMSLRDVFGGRFSYKWFSPFHNSLDFEDAAYIKV